MSDCKIIAIANQKGGTGKITTASNLRNTLAFEEKMLLVDFNPQANLTMSLGIERPDEPSLSAHDILRYACEECLLSALASNYP